MIVVTTPTGAIGRQVLANVLDHDEPIRVIVRDPDRLPSDVRERVEVVPGSHGDPDVVNAAFAGADTVFWLVPPDPGAASIQAAYVDFTRPAAAAFEAQGVERVVGISALGRGVTDDAGLVTGSLAMDDLVASSGVSYRALTMPSFMENILRAAEMIRTQDLFVSPVSGDRKAPSVATRDIAAVAARLLLDHTWSGVESVPVLGPEDLSFDDMAGIISDVLGKPVRYQQVPLEDFKSMLVGFGWSDAMAQGMADMLAAKDAGLDNHEPRTPEATTPTTFRQWCEDVLVPVVTAPA